MPLFRGDISQNPFMVEDLLTAFPGKIYKKNIKQFPKAQIVNQLASHPVVGHRKR